MTPFVLNNVSCPPALPQPQQTHLHTHTHIGGLCKSVFLHSGRKCCCISAWLSRKKGPYHPPPLSLRLCARREVLPSWWKDEVMWWRASLLVDVTASQDPSCTLFSSSLIQAWKPGLLCNMPPKPLPPPGNIIQRSCPWKKKGCARYELGAVFLNPGGVSVNMSLSPQHYDQYAANEKQWISFSSAEYQFS